MTTNEFDLEFDIRYDNASKGAPGIDKHEKSVYLTSAQEELVKATYSGYNESGVGFEGSERKRRQLSELVRDYKVGLELPQDTTSKSAKENLIETSQFFGLPADLMYIVLESAKLKSTDSCLNNKIIPVKPVTHDEFQVEIKNPFKKPNGRKAWRLDLYRYGPNQKAELFSVAEIKEYHIRYVKKPRPIILVDFEEDADLAGLGLTVDGSNRKTECELNTEIHREILNRAVELAVVDYREGNLSNRINTNKRIV